MKSTARNNNPFKYGRLHVLVEYCGLLNVIQIHDSTFLLHNCYSIYSKTTNYINTSLGPSKTYFVGHHAIFKIGFMGGITKTGFSKFLVSQMDI